MACLAVVGLRDAGDALWGRPGRISVATRSPRLSAREGRAATRRRNNVSTSVIERIDSPLRTPSRSGAALPGRPIEPARGAGRASRARRRDEEPRRAGLNRVLAQVLRARSSGVMFRGRRSFRGRSPSSRGSCAGGRAASERWCHAGRNQRGMTARVMSPLRLTIACSGIRVRIARPASHSGDRRRRARPAVSMVCSAPRRPDARVPRLASRGPLARGVVTAAMPPRRVWPAPRCPAGPPRSARGGFCSAVDRQPRQARAWRGAGRGKARAAMPMLRRICDVEKLLASTASF